MHYYNTSDEAMLRIYNSYSDTLSFTDFHFHLCEILSGHEEKATTSLFSSLNYQPPFNFHSCYVLVTGLPQSVYHEVYDWGQRDSVCCFMYEYRPYVRNLLQQNGFDGESFIFLFDGNKHYVTLFSPVQKHTGNILAMAQQINDHLQHLYETYLFDGPSQYHNFTAVSSQITTYNDVSKAFWKTKGHLTLNYFHKESLAIDEDWVQTHSHSLMHLQYDEQLTIFKDMLHAAKEEALHSLYCLFFEHVLPTMSFYECESLLLTIRNILISHAIVCGFPQRIEEETFQFHRYPHWWACYDAIKTLIHDMIKYIVSEKKTYSTITMDAILYIRTHYGNNIYIDSIADAIHIAPNYLSHVFKKDTGVTLHQYLMDVRIGKAKKLLLDPTLRPADIAGMVGFTTPKYFYSVFRKTVGMSPLDYRKSKITPAT